MYGYRMSMSDDEQLHLWHLFADAMARRAPVEVSFFKEKRVLVWSERKQDYVKKFTGLYVKVTRVVEPYAFDANWTTGTRRVLVVDRNPEGVGSQPAYRSVRLDRVAWSRQTGRPIVTRRLSIGYLCPSLLDRRPLHPTKGQLVAALA